MTGLHWAALKVMVVVRAWAVLLVAAVTVTVALPVPWYGLTEHQLPPLATVAVQAVLAVTESVWLDVPSVVNESVPDETDKDAGVVSITGGFVQDAAIRPQSRKRTNLFIMRIEAPTSKIGASVKYTNNYSIVPVPALKSRVTF